MSKISKPMAKRVSASFAPWLKKTMAQAGVTVQTLRTRLVYDGVERGKLTLEGYLRPEDGKAPTPDSVLELVPRLTAKDGTGPSTPLALAHSYPHVLIRIIDGLYQIEGAAAREVPAKHFMRLGDEGLTLLKKVGKARTHWLKCQPLYLEWMKRALAVPGTLPAMLAFAYCVSFDGAPEAAALRNYFDWYHPELERYYERALNRAIDRVREPLLRTAERIAADDELDEWARSAGIRTVVESWILTNRRGDYDRLGEDDTWYFMASAVQQLRDIEMAGS
jgi:hypothetical protein